MCCVWSGVAGAASARVLCSRSAVVLHCVACRCVVLPRIALCCVV